MIPNDPAMLYGYINMKLRDFYPSLSALCEDLDVDEMDLRTKLFDAGYIYDDEINRFKPV